MTQTRNVAVVVGSLRKESFNRKMANALVGMAPQPLVLTMVEIGDLPLFNQDHEADPIPSVMAFKQGIAEADAVLFVTPEYNRSMPGVLKNAIDIGSRPRGKNAWGGKPGAIVSVSPGKLAAFGANHALRQSLMAVDVATMPQPEAYVGDAGKLFDDKGALTDESTRAFMQKFLGAFAQWIERFAAK
jgi:chromate reductase